jgi:hypothetical protein
VENDFDEDMLGQSESLDSDEVRNRDGDEVVDPPDEWIDADDDESLDEKLAAEIPDNPRDDRPSREAHDSDEGGALDVVSDDELDRIDPTGHGREKGQIDGTPEDGDYLRSGVDAGMNLPDPADKTAQQFRVVA